MADQNLRCRISNECFDIYHTIRKRTGKLGIKFQYCCVETTWLNVFLAVPRLSHAMNRIARIAGHVNSGVTGQEPSLGILAP